MCGIAGVLVKSPAERGWLAPRVEAMTAALQHRGPDDEGTWTDESAGVAFGFRRLAIIDLSQMGHQPMVSASGRYTMGYNGEVFNHRALRREVESRGAGFRGHSDTEVMLACFEAWGIAATIRKLVGMFGIAVWDAEERSLHLIRDRLGIKPLHYFWEPGLLAFGSELRALMALREVPRAIDPVAALQFLRYLYVPAPRTILGGVRKLPPGHHLTIREVTRELPPSEPFWSLEATAEAGFRNRVTGTDADVVAEFDHLLSEAVALRLESDVPLGALLSGGIDSSTVVALMQAASSRPVKTYSIAFPGTEHDEGPMARAVAAHLGTDHRELPVDDRAALALAEQLPELNDEPFADPSQIPTYLVSKLARQEVTVALTGDGGDELFAGYNRYLSGPGMISFAQRVPSALRRPVGMAMGLLSEESWALAHRTSSRVFPALRKQRLPGEKARKLGNLLRADTEVGMYRSLLSAWQDPGALLPGDLHSEDPYGRAFDRMSTGRPFLERAMLADQLLYLPDDLLAKVDRMSMAVSLEARVPILDHRVVEFSWRLRPEHKVRDGQGKWILRQVLYRRVPKELVDRPKVGFTVPIADWLRGELRPWAEEWLSPVRIQAQGLLNGNAVGRAWHSFQNGESGLGTGLWAVVMLNAWLDRWGGSPA
jgi:asparagine synthase (glutamine-hydrolysing)